MVDMYHDRRICLKLLQGPKTPARCEVVMGIFFGARIIEFL